MNIKKEYEQFFKRKKNDLCVHDAEDVITFAKHYQALRIHDVVGRSEQLEAICEHVNFVLEANVERFTVDDLQNIIKSV